MSNHIKHMSKTYIGDILVGLAAAADGHHQAGRKKATGRAQEVSNSRKFGGW